MERSNIPVLRRSNSQERDELPPKEGNVRRARSTPALAHTPRDSTSNNEQLRLRIAQLKKELEQEKSFVKTLRREKTLEVKNAREEEQKKFIIFQNDFRESCREDNRKSLELERVKWEKKVFELETKSKKLEENCKLLQEADRRKIDDIRRMAQEHEMEKDKLKRLSWQEGRKQMSEIKQMVNIIEQLEKKLGIEVGYSMRLQMQKDDLYEELNKKKDGDSWNSPNKSGTKLNDDPDYDMNSSDLRFNTSPDRERVLQRKNIELSTLVRKLDEKNQQLAARNTELVSESEKMKKEYSSYEKNRHLHEKIIELNQATHRLEERNKALETEMRSRSPSSDREGRGLSPRRAKPNNDNQYDESEQLKQQLRNQNRTISELKQEVMEKERRIELLKSRRKSSSKRKSPSRHSHSLENLLNVDDDQVSMVSDISDVSEMDMSVDGSTETDRRVKQLTKELLALERNYSLLQSKLGNTMDAERGEMEKEQLQSDLIDCQARIEELEQHLLEYEQGENGASHVEVNQLHEDNRQLYEKLLEAEAERDLAVKQLDKLKHNIKDVEDHRDLLEFQLEEMSQTTSEDVEPLRLCIEDIPDGRESDDLECTAEEIKMELEHMEKEKEYSLSPKELKTLLQARLIIDKSSNKIATLQVAEDNMRKQLDRLEEKYHQSLNRGLSKDMVDQASETDSLEEGINEADFSQLPPVITLTEHSEHSTDIDHQHPSVEMDDKSTMTEFDHDEDYHQREWMDSDTLDGAKRHLKDTRTPVETSDVGTYTDEPCCEYRLAHAMLCTDNASTETDINSDDLDALFTREVSHAAQLAETGFPGFDLPDGSRSHKQTCDQYTETDISLEDVEVLLEVYMKHDPDVEGGDVTGSTAIEKETFDQGSCTDITLHQMESMVKNQHKKQSLLDFGDSDNEIGSKILVDQCVETDLTGEDFDSILKKKDILFDDDSPRMQRRSSRKDSQRSRRKPSRLSLGSSSGGTSPKDGPSKSSVVDLFDQFLKDEKQSEVDEIKSFNDDGDDDDDSEYGDFLSEYEQKSDISEGELELLQLKIAQLKEAEKKIKLLNTSNDSLKQRIADMRINQQRYKQGINKPTKQLRDSGVPISPESSDQESFDITQGRIMLVSELDVARHDDHNRKLPSKELAKLKKENRDLYEELMELRAKAKVEGDQVKQQRFSSEPIEPLVFPEKHCAISSEPDLETKLRELENLPPAPNRDVDLDRLLGQLDNVLAVDGPVRQEGQTNLQTDPPMRQPQHPTTKLMSDLDIIPYQTSDQTYPSMHEKPMDNSHFTGSQPISEPRITPTQVSREESADMDRRLSELDLLDGLGPPPPLPSSGPPVSGPPPLPSLPPPSSGFPSSPLDPEVEALLDSCELEEVPQVYSEPPMDYQPAQSGAPETYHPEYAQPAMHSQPMHSQPMHPQPSLHSRSSMPSQTLPSPTSMQIYSQPSRHSYPNARHKSSPLDDEVEQLLGEDAVRKPGVQPRTTTESEIKEMLKSPRDEESGSDTRPGVIQLRQPGRPSYIIRESRMPSGSKFFTPDASPASPEGIMSPERPSSASSTGSSGQSKKIPPPVKPKPMRKGAFPQHASPVSQHASPVGTPPGMSMVDGFIHQNGDVPAHGAVKNRASSIESSQIDQLKDQVSALERQLRNKENVVRSMRSEATEMETKAMLERKEREMRIMDDEITFLKKENQKKEKELLEKISELNKKAYDIDQWKQEATNAEKQRKRMESGYLNLQNELRNLQGSDAKVHDLEAKNSALKKQAEAMEDKLKELEKADQEFNDLERNIVRLQNHLQSLENVETQRDQLLEKLSIVEHQRDDLLRKGRQVEAERNDFLRNSQVIEQEKDTMEDRMRNLQDANFDLKAKLNDVERELKDLQNKLQDIEQERNLLKTQCNKLENEKNDMRHSLAEVSQERGRLEGQVKDAARDRDKLEDGFHSLRLKVTDLTCQKDEAELAVPNLKSKISLLKRACKEKDELIDKLNEELKELKHMLNDSFEDSNRNITNGYDSPETKKKELPVLQSSRQDFLDGLEALPDKPTTQRKPTRQIPSKPNDDIRTCVALFDYDPQKSSTSGQTNRELRLKKGDYMTVMGDMDMHGYYNAEMNGQKGLVPSLYIEEIDDIDGLFHQQLSLNGHKPSDGPISRDNINGLSTSPGHSSKYPSVGSPGGLSPSSGRSPRALSPTSRRSPSDMSPSSRRVPTRDVSPFPSRDVGSSKKQLFVAVYDHDPRLTSKRPDLELSLKQGDVITILSNVDNKGYYQAEVNGKVGLLPSRFVQGNIAPSTPPQVQSSPNGSLRDGNPRLPQSHSTPMMNGFSNHPAYMMTGMPSIPQPNMQTFPSPVQRSTVGQYQSSPPNILPVAVRPYVPPSPQISRESTGPPNPPGSLHVLRTVNHDAVLVGWTLPDIDEYGRSNGQVVKGYKIYVNGSFKMDVRSAYMAKALIEDLDLTRPMTVGMQTVADNGQASHKISTRFTDTLPDIGHNVSNGTENGWNESGDSFRMFVALYDYDPFTSSPNKNPAVEMRFKEGDMIKVLDTSRTDGFYQGQMHGKNGLIPSNFVEEVAVASTRRKTKVKKSKSPDSSSSHQRSSSHRSRVSPKPSPSSLQRKRMMALYDYSPEEQSPQKDISSELAFKKGHIITVYGDMTLGGYYHGEMNGQEGLVPASFITELNEHSSDNDMSKKAVSFKGSNRALHVIGNDV